MRIDENFHLDSQQNSLNFSTIYLSELNERVLDHNNKEFLYIVTFISAYMIMIIFIEY